MRHELTDQYVDDTMQREWLRLRGFAVRPGDVGLSIALGDSWSEWRLEAQPPGRKWVISRRDPFACCELPRVPRQLADIVMLCGEMGIRLSAS